jgi:hypothetical protein
MVVAISRPRLFFKEAHMLVVVAIQAKQFPVAAIQRVVVVIVILVVDCQFSQARAGKFAAASPADPREQFEGALAISRLALAAMLARLGYDAVEPGMIRDGTFGHEKIRQGRNGFAWPVDQATSCEAPVALRPCVECLDCASHRGGWWLLLGFLGFLGFALLSFGHDPSPCSDDM